jgi:hypothetical protein
MGPFFVLICASTRSFVPLVQSHHFVLVFVLHRPNIINEATTSCGVTDVIQAIYTHIDPGTRSDHPSQEHQLPLRQQTHLRVDR